MAQRPASAPTRPRITARYELADDGLGWTIRIAAGAAGDFCVTASRLQDVELRAYQGVRAVLGLNFDTFDLELIHVLNLEQPAHTQ
jgi:hypothetical protein